MNEVLRRALAQSRLTDTDVAAHLGVDPKTVRHWLSGRKPHPRHRWGVADLLNVSEHELWPEQREPAHQSHPVGLRAIYPHRWALPHELWRVFFEQAQEHIGILVYSGLFLADDPGILAILTNKARSGVRIRLLLGDPDSANVWQRGTEEGIGEAMPAKIRNALVHYKPLLDYDTVELRLHNTVLYTSIYRADEQLLANQHIYGAHAAATPVLHIDTRQSNEFASSYLDSFEQVWVSGVKHRPGT